jgi:hypothetical protein
VISIPVLRDARSNKTPGFVVGGAGLVLLGAGAVLGISVATQCGGFFRETCSKANGLPDDERRDTLARLDTQAWISNVGVAAGLIGVAVGAYLLLTSPKSEPRDSRPMGVR